MNAGAKKSKQMQLSAAPNPNPKPTCLPSTYELAMIASNLMRNEMEIERATHGAFELWKRCNNRIVDAELQRDGSAQFAKERAEERAAILGENPRKEFPASYEDFIREIVNARSISEGNDRFRNYLRHEIIRNKAWSEGWKPIPEDERALVEAEMQVCLSKLDPSSGGGIGAGHWEGLVKFYKEWWDWCVANVRSESGKAGVVKKLEMKSEKSS